MIMLKRFFISDYNINTNDNCFTFGAWRAYDLRLNELDKSCQRPIFVPR